MRTQLSLILVSVLALGACGDDDRTTPDADAPDVSAPDATAPDASEPDMTTAGLACDWPTGPYGTNVGRNMEPFTLSTCDGAPYTFPNEDFCDTRFTVISIGAGWCRPCQIESAQFEAEINERYPDDQVQLIQILTQDADFNAPDAAFCESWVTRYGLTNVELLDPAQLSNIYFPDNALPSTIIVDNQTGIIVFREVGAEEGLMSLRRAIDDLLAGE